MVTIDYFWLMKWKGKCHIVLKLSVVIMLIAQAKLYAQITSTTEQKLLLLQLDSLNQLNQSITRDSLIIKAACKYSGNIYPINDRVLKQQETYLKKIVGHSMYKLANANYLYTCGKLNHRAGYYHIAIEKLFQALEELKENPDSELYISTYNELGGIIILLLINNPEEKSEHTEQFIQFTQSQIENKSTEINDPLLIGTSYINLGTYYLTLKKYPEAEKSYRQAWQSVQQSPQKYWYMYHNGKWAEGLSQIYQGKTKKGFALVDSVKALCNDKADRSKTYLRDIMGFLLSDYYFQRGEYDLALAENLEAKACNDRLKIVFFEHFINKNFYKIYKAKKDYKKALIYYEDIVRFNNKLEENNTREYYTMWANKQENIQKDILIKTLELENYQQGQTRQKTLRNSLILGLLSVIFIALYILRSNNKLKNINASLEKKNAEIESALFKGQIIERKRVANELHDTLSIKLSALKWRLEAVEDNFLDKNKKDIAYVIQSLEELYTDVRFISHNLQPEELDKKGLKTALTTLVEKLNLLNRTKFHVVFDGFEGTLEQIVQYEIYNVILELCNNVLKHAQAANAYISLSEINENLFLTVVDDGKGFENNQKPKGKGYQNIKSRIEDLGGTIEVKTGKSGTGVEVRV